MACPLTFALTSSCPFVRPRRSQLINHAESLFVAIMLWRSRRALIIGAQRLTPESRVREDDFTLHPLTLPRSTSHLSMNSPELSMILRCRPPSQEAITERFDWPIRLLCFFLLMDVGGLATINIDVILSDPIATGPIYRRRHTDAHVSSPLLDRS